MADETVLLNNYSDDSQIKRFMTQELAPRVFHNIPLSVLNTGFFSLVNEYISQITEQLGFTSSFYFNESFITKAVLPDSVYAEAAIFNIGYSFATPASTNFLLELKIEDIHKNAVYNADNKLYEFILDKDTKFNLPEGFIYSLDYDILIQYKNKETSTRDAVVPIWNVQYINRDEANVCATNKRTYITYRVTDKWLCLMIQANEYERQTHVVVNNMTNGIPNEDKVITCDNHIAGFDIKYIDSKGNEQWLKRDHILAIHDSVKDNKPYVHYIMDNPQTIRFMWQLNGNRYFIPETNSSYEIIIYTCHGKAANAPSYKNKQQPNVITSANKYSNNGNVMKAAFVISGCVGGTNIGTMETVRRETIEAYNTANVISTDHDIDEWFKTFYFKNILYPFFFKRRDDPWGRIWSGFIALTTNDDYVYRTNTLHGKIPYEVLYNNEDNNISNNEIIIPPGWIWTYTTGDDRRYAVTPYTKGNGYKIETVKTLKSITDKFVFANPFGIRIQKAPFAIGYFNPWVNEYVTATKVNRQNLDLIVDNHDEDISQIYHASHIITHIKRTYKDDYYRFTTYILPTMYATIDGQKLVEFLRVNAVAPLFSDSTWSYFKRPLDMFATSIPMLALDPDDGYIPFDPDRTYLCVRTKDRLDDNTWKLSGIWIEDKTTSDTKDVDILISADKMYLYGLDKVWGDKGYSAGYEVYKSGETEIELYRDFDDVNLIMFDRVKTQNYYELRLSDKASQGSISKIIVKEAYKTELTKYGETSLIRIGKSYQTNIYLNVYYNIPDEEGEVIETVVRYNLNNAANVYIPYEWDEANSGNGSYQFNLDNVGSSGIILYADMKPSPESGAVDYYRIPFSKIPTNEPIFYVHSEQLPMKNNNMRVVMHTIVNGTETGRCEMQPVQLDDDGSYQFESTMYPLTELIDIDNRINISSIENNGGSWIALNGDTVTLDATEPKIKISILMKSDDIVRNSEINGDASFIGYRIIDEYMLDDVDLIQELKEMRSVVKFGDTSMPTQEQITLYKDMFKLSEYNENDPYNIYYLKKYAYTRKHSMIPSSGNMNYPDDDCTFESFQNASNDVRGILRGYFNLYNIYMKKYNTPDWFSIIDIIFNDINNAGDNGNSLDWEEIYGAFEDYPDNVNDAFKDVEVNGGMEIQLMPFTEYSLMKDDKFEDFVISFTQVHKAIEPVIFKRLEGNNYLDCKLIATYGLPHSYSSDIDIEDEKAFWPDLNVQVEFDVKLYNQSLVTNTINELRTIIKSYFNRITSVHTPVDAISMDNNIYISHVIQQMESHDNVAWLKFKGWHTDEKGKPNGNYMNAEYQAIEQKWKKLEDMPTDELERYVPEMFVLEDDNIVINIIK